MRPRLRELGYSVGGLPPGPSCSLVDVPGVRVGHLTLVEGDDVRTGVTAVLPHGGNLYADKVLGACHVINGYGKITGLSQLAELGTLESPILITNTLSVGPVWEGGLRHVLGHDPDLGRDRDTVNVVVGECFDGWLNDARALRVRPQHALEAIAAASEDERGEGSLGAGTGTTCFGFKAGVGCASRLADGISLGCLVVANFGARRDVHMLTGRFHDSAGQPPARDGGSIVIVLGTDAPLSERQLRRLAARSAFGLGRAGSFASNGSGEYALAFSTAHRVPHRASSGTVGFGFLRDDSPQLRQLFEAAGEVTAEAVLNSLCVAEPMTGRAGHHVEALPHALLSDAPALRRR